MSTISDDVRRVSIYINGESADLTLKKLTASSRTLKNELSNLTIGTDEYKEKLIQLQDTNGVLQQVRDDIAGIDVSMQHAGESTGKFEAAIERVTNVGNIGARVVTQFSRQIIGLGVGFISLEIGAKAIKALIDQIKQLDYFTGRLDQAKHNLAALNEVMKDADKDSGKQVANLKILYAAATDVNSSMAYRLAAARELKAEYPAQLAASSALAIANGEEKKSIDELTKSILQEAKVRAVQAKIEGIERQKSDIEYTKQKIRNAQSNQITDAQSKYKSDPNSMFAKNNLAGRINEANAEAKSAQYEAQQNIDVLNRTEDFLISFAGGAPKLAKSLESGNQLIQDPLKEFNAIIKNASQKEDLENLKKALQAKMDALGPNDKQIAVYKAKIKEVEELEKKYDAKLKPVKGDPKIKADEEAVARQKAIAEELARINAQEAADTKSANDKEIEEVKAKYDELKQKELDYQVWVKENKNLNKGQKDSLIATSNNTIGQINNDQQGAVDTLKLKQAKTLSDEIKKFQDEQAANTSENLDKEAAKINEFYDNLRAKLASDDYSGAVQVEASRMFDTAKANLNAKAAQEEKYQQDMQGLKDEYAEITDKKEDEEKAKLKKKYDDELKALEDQLKKEQITKEQYDKLSAQEKINYDKSITNYEQEQDKKRMTQALDDVQQTVTQQFEMEQQGRDESLNSMMSNLEEQKNFELSNKSLTEIQKQNIEISFQQQEKQAKIANWKANQKASEEQAIINGALGLTKLWVDPGFPTAIPLAIELAATTAAQVATIASQEVPHFYSGGYSAVSTTAPQGWVTRPTLFTNSASGRPFSAGEGNKSEYIISSTQLQDPVIANFVGMMEANRGVRRFENGGYSGTSSTGMSAPGAGGMAMSASSDRLDRIESLLHEFITAQANINALPVVFNTQAYDEYRAKLTKIITKATI